jgi:predicted Zn-dependent protease
MRRKTSARSGLAGGAVACMLVAACATSPLGREQLILFPDDEMQQMGAAAFQQIKEQTRQSDTQSVNRYVECVAGAVTSVVDDGRAGDWEVTVFAQDQVNAFALPGRKIGIYTGLLDVAENQDQLATVIAHEVAHVLARHGNERLSTQYATSTGLDLVAMVAGSDTATKQTALGLLGLGAQVGVLLPFSRNQETEADVLGLELMAKAGFDPGESVDLWRNMIGASEGAPPEFLSTHPSGESRIAVLQGRLPQVANLAQQARAAGRRPDCGD